MNQIHICINLELKKKGDTYLKRITLSFIYQRVILQLLLTIYRPPQRFLHTLRKKVAIPQSCPITLVKYRTETWIFQYPMKDFMIFEVFSNTNRILFKEISN